MLLNTKGLYSQPFTVFDTETTGVDPAEHRVIEVGFAHFKWAHCTLRGSTFCNPWPELPEFVEEFVDPEIWDITNIKSSDIQKAKSFDAAVGLIDSMTKDAAFLVAYNAPFDAAMLKAEFGRLGQPHLADIFDEGRVVDPLVWVRERDKYVKGKGKYKLTNTCARYGIVVENAHRADADAYFTGKLFLKLWLDKVIPDMSLDELLQKQTSLRKKQDDEFQAYLERKRRKENA